MTKWPVNKRGIELGSPLFMKREKAYETEDITVGSK